MRNTLIEISNHRGTHFRSNLLSCDVWRAHFCFHNGLYVGQEQTQENFEGGALEDVEVMNHSVLTSVVHISFQSVVPIQGRSTRIISLAQLGIHWGKLVSMPGVGR